eukprot:m51a1_g3678 hypothetical protein (561) ;mRNA; f:305607-307719
MEWTYEAVGGSAEAYAAALVGFLRAHQSLFNMSVYDSAGGLVGAERVTHFVVGRHWERRVPPEWSAWLSSRAALVRSPADEDAWLQMLMDFHAGCPASLAAFMREAAALAQPARVVLGQRYDEGPVRSIETTQDAAVALMSQKKKHETRLLGDTLVAAATRDACDSLVDVGAGKGYLTQYVKLKMPQLNVVAIEGSEHHAQSYRDRSEYLQAKLTEASARRQRRAAAAPSARPSDSPSEIRESRPNPDPDSSSAEVVPTAPVVAARIPLGEGAGEFFRKVSSALGPGLAVRRVLVAGLHTCGDLAPTILRLFLDAPEAVSLVSVGCCYHQMTEDPDARRPGPRDPASAPRSGFPLSAALRAGPGRVDYHLCSGRHVAAGVLGECIGLEAMRHTCARQSFRAGLEALLDARVGRACAGGPFAHHTGSTRARCMGEFGTYAVESCRKMLRKLAGYTDAPAHYREALGAHLSRELSTDQGAQRFAEDARAFFRSIGGTESGLLPEACAFAALRQLIGPLVEALVLVDRLLYLREHAGVADAALVRLFMPDISPRSVALVARKL